MLIPSRLKASSFLLLFCLFLMACGKQQLSPSEYVEWLKTHQEELSVERIVGNYKLRLQYLPVDYLFLMNGDMDQLQKDSLEQFKREHKGIESYLLSISMKDDHPGDPMHTGGNGEANYASKFDYFSFRVKDDLQLLAGKDTIPCLVSQFEPPFGISPECRISLSFQGPSDTMIEDRFIQYDDKVLSVGKINFQLKASTINQLPQLVIL